MKAKPRMPKSKERIDQFRFLPVSPRDRDWGLFVTGAGYQVVPPNSPYPPRGHLPAHDWAWRRGRVLQEYAVIYVVSGKGEFETKSFGTTAVEAGSVMLLFPGVWHRYRPEKKVGWNEYWATFQGEYADRLREQGFLSPEEPVFHIGSDEMVQRAFSALLDRVRCEAHEFQRLVSVSMLEIIACILEGRHNKKNDSHLQELVRQAKLAMEGSTWRQSTIKDLIETLGLSPSYFHKVFKDYVGVTPYQYRLQTQINRAKKLLHDTNLSVKQIGYAVEFPNIDQFSKMFKKKVGMTPSEYRNGGPDAKATKLFDELRIRERPLGRRPAGKKGKID